MVGIGHSSLQWASVHAPPPCLLSWRRPSGELQEKARRWRIPDFRCRRCSGSTLRKGQDILLRPRRDQLHLFLDMFISVPSALCGWGSWSGRGTSKVTFQEQQDIVNNSDNYGHEKLEGEEVLLQDYLDKPLLL